MNFRTPVDFKKLVEKVHQPQFSQMNLTILGGQCNESNLIEFLKKWDMIEMPYRIWEYASEIDFGKNPLPQNVVLLERGRVFGPRGDLMLNRNEAAFVWRFIGPGDIQAPAGTYGMRDYWESHPNVKFHQYEEAALLWGQWNGKRWTEGRVAAAILCYPMVGQRIQLHYKVFSYTGQVKFVWYTGLSEWKEADNG